MRKLDAKFYGRIHKAKDDSLVPEDQYVVFLAKDSVFAAMFLDHKTGYLARCKQADCDEEQIAAVEAMADRLKEWREVNWMTTKAPDAKGERLLV